MTNVTVYNKDGNASDESQAPALLSAPWNASLVHQVFKAMAANQRRPIAHTKTRGEVSGGGIKPWRQKGTGRARHGSIRSPIWRHGGVTFGPRKDKDYSQKINKKMAAAALASALAKKMSAGQLRVIEDFNLTSAKTKELARIINNLTHGRSTLLVVNKNDQLIRRAGANLSRVDIALATDLNVYDVLTHFFVVMDKKVMESLEKIHG